MRIATASFARPSAYALSQAALYLLVALFAWFLIANYELFWDLDAYMRAAAAYGAGGDPYRSAAALRFVYPPVTLPFFAAVAWAGPWSLVALNACAFALPMVRARTAAGFARYFPLLALPGSALGLYAFATGNVAFALYALLLPCLWLYLRAGGRRGTGLLLAAAIVFAAAFKMQLLAFAAAFLLLPPFGYAAAGGVRALAAGALWLAATTAAAAGLILVPVAGLGARDWLGSLAAMSDGFTAHLGHSLATAVQAALAPVGAAAGRAGFALVVAAVAAPVLIAMWRAAFARRAGGLRPGFAFVALAAILLNPRLKDYDAFLLPLLIVFAVEGWGMRARWVEALRLALCATALLIALRKLGIGQSAAVYLPALQALGLYCLYATVFPRLRPAAPVDENPEIARRPKPDGRSGA